MPFRLLQGKESSWRKWHAKFAGTKSFKVSAIGLTPPGSPTLVEIAQFNQVAPSGDTLVLPQVTPARKPSSRKLRVSLSLASVLLMLLAAVAYRIQTDSGTLVVTIVDPAVRAILEQDGLVIHDKNSDHTWTIKAAEKKPLPSGEYQLKGGQNLQLLVTDDSGVELTTDTFTLRAYPKTSEVF